MTIKNETKFYIHHTVLSFASVEEMKKATDLLDNSGIDFKYGNPSHAHYEDLVEDELIEVSERLEENGCQDVSLDISPKEMADLIAGCASDDYTNGEVNEMVSNAVRDVLREKYPEIAHEIN